jgi:short-subunit dehydrogenase involved in D-alanine esterification of teichoic acids
MDFSFQNREFLVMPNPVIGKVALVTGGSRGIGAAVVRRLASDGATVAFSYAASEDRAKALAWEKLQLSKVYAGHHPDNRASEKILKKLGFEFIENVFYKPTGLMHPSYVCMAPTPRPNTSTLT